MRDFSVEDFVNRMLYGDVTELTKPEKPFEHLRTIPVNYSAVMKTDGYTDENGTVHLEIEMPGFNKDEIDIELHEGKLTISAEKKEKEENTEKFILRERKTSCVRTFSVPASKTVEDFKVTYANGILHISFDGEKPEEKANSKISIQD